MLPRPAHVWGGIALGATLLDIYADRGEPDGDTASECIRSLFRTDTTIGKAAFGLTLAVGVQWFYPHICNGPLRSSPFST